LAISAGFVYSFGTVLITKKTQLPTYLAGYDAFLELEGDDMFAYGFNAGLMFKPTNFISIGASYHSEVKYNFEGTATILEAPDAALNQIPSGNIKADLTTPQNIAGGIAVDISNRVKLSADFQYVGWSSYDKLEVVFTDPEPDVVNSSPRLYDDSFIVRLGGAYKANDQVTFMCGIYYDKNPVSNKYLNPSLPESNRIGLSFGIEAQLFERLSFQGSYLFIRGKQLTIDNSEEVYNLPDYRFNGTYNTYANIFAISFNYSL
jgi:long-chain fatty acid transport protein